MKLVLPDALHARPADLLVRLAGRSPAAIEIRVDGRKADPKNVLQVLALRAAKGTEIEVDASGEGAAEAISAIAELVARNFDADLLPEMGAVAAEGIAIGRAVVVPEAEPAAMSHASLEGERARALKAFKRVAADLDALLLELSPPERALFAPEVAILRGLEPEIVARIGDGMRVEEAIERATDTAPTDLITDLRARLLDALGGPGPVQALLAAIADSDRGDDVVVVTRTLTPTLVAKLPVRVVGIVAADIAVASDAGPGSSSPSLDGYRGPMSSHAAILARGRGIPLLHVPADIVSTIADDDVLVLDTTAESSGTEAMGRLWVAPSDETVAHARRRRDERARELVEAATESARPLTQLRVAVRVNVGSLDEEIPPGAEGSGLVRTELLFVGRLTPPGELEQVATLLAVRRRVPRGPIVVRLFDAGGDKPLPWLVPPPGPRERDEEGHRDQTPLPGDDVDHRGIALLLRHPAILDTQLRAIARVADGSDVRVLLPLTRSADDVHEVGSRLRACPAARSRTLGPIRVGAMIETAGAVDAIDAIASAADFLCIGTNDLSASARMQGSERIGAPQADLHGAPRRVFAWIAHVTRRAHALGKAVTVCGELAGTVDSARLLVGLGVDALSVAPARFTAVKIGLAHCRREDCENAARAVAGLGAS